MKTIIIIAALFCVYKIITSVSAKRKEQALRDYMTTHPAE